MRIAILSMALLITSVTTQAQKCKYDFEKKDPFTGKSQKGSSVIVAGFGDAGFRILLQAEEKKYLLGLVIVLPGDNLNSIQPGDSLLLALENGEVLTFRANAQCRPNARIMYNSVYTVYTPFYDLSAADVDKLESVKLKASKLKLGAQPLLVEVSKNADKLKMAAACIKQ